MSAEDHDQKNNDAHDDIPDTPGVIAHPALIYAGGLSAGLLASYFLPVTFLPRRLARVLGWLLNGSGLILDFLGDRALRNAETNINPYEPVTTIVVEGPYRFTPNPLYLAGALIYAGIAVRLNGLWAALLLPLVLAVVHRGVIEREERYLEGKFGEEYLRYKTPVQDAGAALDLRSG
jgi:protein-S-isoprenylcysteine O-methyltransferase Ste14